MKIIFLDFDGVLNSDIYFNSSVFKTETRGMSQEEIMLVAHRTHIDPIALQLLNKLVETSGATVVVSSSWRIGYTVEELNVMLKGCGATFEIVAATPRYPDYIEIGWGRVPTPRGDEIQGYLNSLNEKPESFVILDDIDNMAHLKEFLVLTDGEFGLTSRDVEKALKILG
jgi:hypothetical protein